MRSKAWTEASWLEYRPLTHDRERVPVCCSSQTCQSWVFVRSQKAIASDGSKSGRAIVAGSKRSWQTTVVRPGSTGIRRWTSR